MLSLRQLVLIAICLAGCLAGCFKIAPAIADEASKKEKRADAPISYYRDVRPIFQRVCFGCHQPAKPQGGLVMTAYEGMLKGGDSEEPAISPGKPGDSPLVELITPQDGERPEMPKDAKPLVETEVALIKKWIATGAKNDTPEADAVVFSAANPPKYHLPPVITSLNFSPDSALLAVSGYHEVLLYKADGSELLARLVGLSERIESNVFSPDGKWLAVSGGSPGRMGELQIWDIQKRKLKRSVTVTYDTIYGASWSPDGKLIAFGCGDNTLRAIEFASGKEIFYQRTHSDWVMDSVFSVKGTHLVSVSRDRTMKLNIVAEQRFVDNITSITPGALKGGLLSVDRNPTKDELLIGGSDGVPKIYQMIRTKARKIGDDFNLVRKFPSMPGRVDAVEYSRDAKQVVAASTSGDGSGHVWVFPEAGGKDIVKMQGIEGGAYTCTFSPDGKVVASGGFSGTVYLNEAATGKLIKKFVSVPLQKATEVAGK